MYFKDFRRRKKKKKIVTFIVSLDKEFEKYKPLLLISFKKQNFDGNCLHKIEKNDLMTFGIDDFAHRTQIYDAIKSLKNGKFQTPENIANDIDEGYIDINNQNSN